MISRNVAFSILLTAIFAVVIWIVGSHLAFAQQPGRLPMRRCVGIATATLRTEDPVITRVYRLYDDGTVETLDDGAPDAKWTRLGQ